MGSGDGCDRLLGHRGGTQGGVSPTVDAGDQWLLGSGDGQVRRGSIRARFRRVFEVVGEHADGGVAVEDLLQACPSVVDCPWSVLTVLKAGAEAPLPVA